MRIKGILLDAMESRVAAYGVVGVWCFLLTRLVDLNRKENAGSVLVVKGVQSAKRDLL